MQIKRLLRNLVLVKPEELVKVTEGGILLPNDIKVNQTVSGTVLMVGEGTEKDGKLIPVDLKVGDKVFYRSDSGIRIEKLVILREEEIYAAIEA